MVQVGSALTCDRLCAYHAIIHKLEVLLVNAPGRLLGVLKTNHVTSGVSDDEFVGWDAHPVIGRFTGSIVRQTTSEGRYASTGL